MSELDDEIARIAALRGRPADTQTYVAKAREIEQLACAVSDSDIRGLMAIGTTDDLRVFDQLPRRSRQALAALPFAVSSIKYRDLARRVGEDAAIAALHRHLPQIMRERAPRKEMA